MTALCKENIKKAIRNTYSLLKTLPEIVNDEDSEDDDIVKTMRLTKTYKFQIYLIPLGNHSCDLTYYILNEKDRPIDQVSLGFVSLNDDITEQANKELSYLFNMYC